ncbi:unnamed protein product [Ixodes pacificus]
MYSFELWSIMFVNQLKSSPWTSQAGGYSLQTHFCTVCTKQARSNHGSLLAAARILLLLSVPMYFTQSVISQLAHTCTNEAAVFTAL